MAPPTAVCLLVVPDGAETHVAQMKEIQGALPASAFQYVLATDYATAIKKATQHKDNLQLVVTKAGSKQGEDGVTLLRALQQIHIRKTQVFNVLYSKTLSLNPRQRLVVMEDPEADCQMVSHVHADVVRVADLVAKESKNEGSLTCPICAKGKMTEEQMWWHLPMFHVALKKAPMHHFHCPSCGKNSTQPLLPHYHDAHAPPGAHIDARRSVALYSFGLCVIQRQSDKKFLVVQEFCNQGYWLPGGGIDPSERPEVAARRECLEEAGVKVKLTGVLRVEISPSDAMTRARFIFFGHPEDEEAPNKTAPDFESMGSCWVSLEDVQSGTLRMRGGEPVEWFTYIMKGGPVYPLSILSSEISPVILPSTGRPVIDY